MILKMKRMPTDQTNQVRSQRNDVHASSRQAARTTDYGQTGQTEKPTFPQDLHGKKANETLGERN